MNQRIKRKAVRSVTALAVLIACLIVPAVSFAQGAFYAEEERDGRIYVFNSMKTYQMWKETGEIGVSITRPGEGPNGETIVFDTDEAIHLYNFRHGKQGEVLIRPEAPKPATMKFSWKDGKTTFDTDTASLVLTNRIQVRFTQEDPENGSSKGSFRIRRAKTKMSGWFTTKNLTYEVQLNWADTASSLEDANLNYDLTSGTGMFQIKAGQFKVPFGWQELTSSGSQEFVDRSIVSNEFAKGRDIGLQLWGTPMGGKVDWRVGVFNGAGRNRTTNDNDKYQYNARVMWQPFGEVKASEADFDSKDTPLFALAAQFEDNDLHGATTGNDIARTILGADAVLKYKGLFVFGEYYQRENDPETGASSDSDGYNLQAGYFVIPARLEIAARLASWDPSDLTASNDRSETGVAVSYYWNKHNMKLQGDYRQLEDDARKAQDNELRLQLQFIF